MGTYYSIVCRPASEKIDPGRINDLGVKGNAIAHLSHPIGSIAIFALRTRWLGLSIVLMGDNDEDVDYFVDVTQFVLYDYNAHYGTFLEYTV